MKKILVFALLALLMSCSRVAHSEVPSVNLAQRYLGMHEVHDRAALKNLIAVDPRFVPWCAAFVNAVLAQMGVEGTNSLMARSFLSFGSKIQKPRVGDIVVLRRGSDPASGHVGFYMGEQGNYIRVLGGNQARSVSIALYSKRQLLGYRRIDTARNGTSTTLMTKNSCDPRSENWAWTARC